MAFPKSVQQLCTPAYVYFVLSVIGIIGAMIQNLGGHKKLYSLGPLHIPVPHVNFVFIMKIIYVFFWTYLLNLICKDGHKEISWFLVLIPFIMLFVVMVMAGRDIRRIKKEYFEDE